MTSSAIVPANSIKDFEFPTEVFIPFRAVIHTLLQTLLDDLSRQLQDGPEHDNKLKSLFIKEFKHLPAKLNGSVSFLPNSVDVVEGKYLKYINVSEYTTTLISINSEWGKVLREMSIEANSKILNEALKKFKPEYYRSFQSEIAVKSNSRSTKSTNTPPPKNAKITASKTQLVTKQETFSKETLPKKVGKNPLKAIPATPKKTEESGYFASLDSEDMERANGLFEQLVPAQSLTQQKKGAIKAHKAAHKIATREETSTETHTPVVAHPKVKSVPIAPKQQKKQASADIVETWIVIFEKSSQLKDPEAILSCILLFFETMNSESKLKCSLEAWSAMRTCIVKSKLKSTLIKEALRKQFLSGNQDNVYQDLANKSSDEKDLGQELLENTLRTSLSSDDVMNEEDISCLIKYVELIRKHPYLYNTQFNNSYILPIVDELIVKGDNNSISLACDLVSNSVPASDPKMNIKLFSCCRAVIVRMEDRSADDPVIMQKTVSLLDMLKENDNFARELNHILKLNPQVFADSILVRALEKVDKVMKDKKGGPAKLIEALDELRPCIKRALQYASKGVLLQVLPKLEKFAATLKNYQLSFEKFCEILTIKLELEISPEDNPTDPLKPVRGIQKVSGNNKKTSFFGSVESNNYIKQLTYALDSNPEAFAKQVLLRAIEKFDSVINIANVSPEERKNELTKLTSCIGKAIDHSSETVFLDLLPTLERMAAALKENGFPFDSLSTEIVFKLAKCTSPEEDPQDPFKAFRRILDIIGYDEASFILFATTFATYILKRSTLNNLRNEDIFQERINALIRMMNPKLDQMEQPEKREAFLEDPKMQMILKRVLRRAVKHPEDSIYYVNNVLRLYRQWTNESVSISSNWLSSLFPDILTVVINTLDFTATIDPRQLERKRELRPFWSMIIQSFMFTEDALNAIKDMIAFGLVMDDDIEKFIQISINFMDDDFSAGIDSFKSWKPVNPSQQWTIGGFTELLSVLRMAWIMQIPTEEIKQNVWHLLVDYYIKCISQICLEYPAINDPERKNYVKPVNAALNEARLILEDDINEGVKISSLFDGGKNEQIRRLHSQLAVYRHSITAMVASAYKTGSPGFVFGLRPIQLASRLFNYVDSSKKVKLPLLDYLLIYATEHVILFTNNLASAEKLVLLTQAALHEGLNEYYLHDPSKGFNFKFNQSMENSSSEPAISPFDDPAYAQSLQYLKEQLTILGSINALRLAKCLTQEYWNGPATEVKK